MDPFFRGRDRLSGGGRQRIEDLQGLEATLARTLSEASEDPESFVSKLGKTGRLTAQEEVELAKRIQRGDHRAQREIVRANLSLVASVTEEYRGQGLSPEELNSAGVRGLVRAAESFDYGKGFRFSGYARHWVRQTIVRALSDPTR